MAEETNNQAPATAPAIVQTPAPSEAPAAAPTPAPAAAPAAAAPATSPADTQAQAAADLQKAKAAYEKAADLANQPTTTKPAPHARLLAMVNGLATGLSAFGTSLATQGREGGAKEVAEIEGAQQEQKLRAQSAATAQKNAQIQQQLMVADTNQKLASNVMLLAKSHVEAQSGKLGVIGQAQDIRTKALQDFITTGDINAYQGTLQQIGETNSSTPNAAAPSSGAAGAGSNAPGPSAPAAGAAPTGATSAIPPVAMSAWQNSVDSASMAYPNDPQIKQYSTVLKDENATPMQKAQAANAARNRMSALDASAESRSKQDTARQGSAYGRLSTPQALQEPGAQAAIDAAINDPTTPVTDVPKLLDLKSQAFAAQKNADEIKRRQATADQQVKMGDPKSAGALLASHDTTISELKSRGMTPEYIAEAIKSAKAVQPDYNAIADDNYAKIAGSEANNQFFGNVGSLLSSGGTLDQLADAGKALSQSDIGALNKAKNWYSLQVGEGGVSAAAAKVVGVADDYAKVMGGSTGSDAARAMVLHIIDPSLSPEQRTEAIQAMKDSVKSQADSRIGSNPFLKIQYGELTKTSGAQSGKGVSLASARQLPAMKGKTDDEIKAAIQAQGHQVLP